MSLLNCVIDQSAQAFLLAGVSQHVDQELVFHQFDIAVSFTAGYQGHPDGLSGGVGRMQNARPAVGSFPVQINRTVLGVKAGSHGDKLADPGRAFPNQDIHRVDVAQAGPGFQGVFQVQKGRILFVHGRSDTSLGQPGIGVLHGLLNQDRHPSVAGGFQGSKKPGDSSPDNQEVNRAEIKVFNWWADMPGYIHSSYRLTAPSYYVIRRCYLKNLLNYKTKEAGSKN